MTLRQPNEFIEQWANAMRVGEPGTCKPPNLCRLCEKPFGNRYVGTFMDETVCQCRSFWKFGLSHEERTIVFDELPYHVLDGESVQALRESSAAGGLAYCERCGVAVFVPGYPDAGIPFRNFPGTIIMKGQRL